MKRNIVITGGAGFIGSHVVRLFVNKYPDYKIINVDKLTYAGNLANLKDIEDKPNYKFVKMDICDFDAFYQLMQDEKIDGIIHLAAESHVDRSIKDPFTFAKTNNKNHEKNMYVRCSPRAVAFRNAYGAKQKIIHP